MLLLAAAASSYLAASGLLKALALVGADRVDGGLVPARFAVINRFHVPPWGILVVLAASAALIFMAGGQDQEIVRYYAVSVFAQDWHLTGTVLFVLLPLAAAVGGVIAIPLGLVALRVRRHTFVVITIAFFFIFQLMAFNFTFTGGTSGLVAPILNWAGVTYNNPFYYGALLLAAATVAVSWLIRRSRFGLHLRAIRDDEDRARGLGVAAFRVKLAAFVLSGMITAVAGGLWYYFIGAAAPQSAFDPLFDLSLALMAFFGGLGTVAGPVLGALVLEPAQQWLTARFTSNYLSEILLGALFLVVILFMPRGVLPTASERVAAWRAARRRRGEGAPP